MITAIIQARVGSSRLSQKMLRELHGYRLIEWVLYRVKQARLVDNFILAIPDTPENDCLVPIGESYGFRVARGDEQDVLGRFHAAASMVGQGLILRICADNPVVAPTEIDRLIEFFNQTNCDYAYNHIPRDNLYPDGLGAEIVKFETLAKLHREALLPQQREHLFNYIWDHPAEFRIATFHPDDERIRHPELKLDIDTMDDYNWFKKLPLHRTMSPLEIVGAALAKPR